MDEDLWLEDGLEELFLGVPGAPEAPVAVKHRGFPAKRLVWKPKEESEDEYEFRMMLEATWGPEKQLAAFQDGRKRQLAALSIGRQARHYESLLTPSLRPMSQADKRKLEPQKILDKLGAAERLRQEKEKYARQMAMNVKMAKVRSHKRRK